MSQQFPIASSVIALYAYTQAHAQCGDEKRRGSFFFFLQTVKCYAGQREEASACKKGRKAWSKAGIAEKSVARVCNVVCKNDCRIEAEHASACGRVAGKVSD